ncbi:E3 ubiquitin-protein ligase RNF4-like [Lathamus discolor]|uniref:E3 ubiquitin-protein ligase RNF4-like n=1 Tax=Lathamus discolor TaxID=678569 RepID=UPI0032B881A2
MSSGQRKRRGGPHNSRLPRKRVRLMASTSARASEAEPIELGESAPEEREDLAGPSSNPAVTDLTLDDSDETDAEAPEEVDSSSSESSLSDILAPTRDDSDELESEGELMFYN